jgi:hypothetical protein
MLIAVLACFVICLLPLKVMFLWLFFVDTATIQSLGLEAYLNLTYACRIMFYINSASNPILYNFMSTRFHQAFSRTIGRKVADHVAAAGTVGIEELRILGKGEGVRVRSVRVHSYQLTPDSDSRGKRRLATGCNEN